METGILFVLLLYIQQLQLCFATSWNVGKSGFLCFTNWRYDVKQPLLKLVTAVYQKNKTTTPNKQKKTPTGPPFRLDLLILHLCHVLSPVDRASEALDSPICCPASQLPSVLGKRKTWPRCRTVGSAHGAEGFPQSSPWAGVCKALIYNKRYSCLNPIETNET